MLMPEIAKLMYQISQDVIHWDSKYTWKSSDLYIAGFFFGTYIFRHCFGVLSMVCLTPRGLSESQVVGNTIRF